MCLLIIASSGGLAAGYCSGMTGLAVVFLIRASSCRFALCSEWK